jgi:hypothetical protein
MKPRNSVFKKLLNTPALQTLALLGATLTPLLIVDLTLSGCASDCDGCGGCDEESSCPDACASVQTQEQCLTGVRSNNPTAPSSCCSPTPATGGCTAYAPTSDPACFTAAPANPPADMFGASGAVSAASANLATAQAALEEAEKLDDPKPEVSAAPLADAAQSAAASDAGQVKDLSLGNVGVPNLGGLNAGVGPAGGTGKSDGGKLSNGPGSSILGTVGGGTLTEPSPAASAAQDAGKSAQAGIGVYTASRSGGSGMGSVDAGAGFGSGGGGEGGAAESLSFGSASQTGSGEATPTDSETPDDYLARIPLNDSLFKRVEKKLQEKERYWSPSNPANRLK